MGCVIEDDKVLTDDIFDQILAWEDDVQSVDMTSMQKLWLCIALKPLYLSYLLTIIYSSYSFKKHLFVTLCNQ